MRIIDSKRIAKLLIFTMFLIAFAPVVFADEIPGFELPVTIKLSGLPPTNAEDYRIVLEADNPAYPLPPGSVDGKYTLITRQGEAKLPELKFPSRGVYTYTIYQLPGTNRLGHYDNIRYQLVVYVTNAIGTTNGSETGSSLEITVLLYQQGEKDKLDEVLFENSYDRDLPPPGPGPGPGPDPDPDPDPPPTPITPTPTPTPAPQEPEEELIEEEIPEAIPEVAEEVEEPTEEIEEIEEIEEDIPEGQLMMPKTGQGTSGIYYGLGTVLLGVGIGTGRKKKKKE